MSFTDHALCVLASLFGATVAPLIQGEGSIKSPLKFAVATGIGAGFSLFMTPFVAEWMTASGYLPGMNFGDRASCLFFAVVLGLCGEQLCRAILGSFETRTGPLGRLVRWLLGDPPQPPTPPTPPTGQRAHRPDSDPPPGMAGMGPPP